MEQELFARAPIPRAYFKMALPVVLSMLVSLVYNMVDTWFIAQTQNTALVAGVSLCAPMFTLMVAMGDIFGLGGSSLISRLLGQGEEKRVRHVSAFCSYGAIVWGVLVGALMLIFRQPILHLLGASSDTMDSAMAYYSYLALGAPAIIFTLVPSNILRTEGMAVASMVGSITGTVVNIILDPIMIFGLGPVPQMGIRGAAWATGLGQLLTLAAYLLFAWIRPLPIRISLKSLKFDLILLKKIYAVGIPATLNMALSSLLISSLNAILAVYGQMYVMILGVYYKLQTFLYLPANGIIQGMRPLIGYNYGAGEQKRVHKLYSYTLYLSAGIMLTGTLLCMFIPGTLLGLFTTNPQTITAGSTALRIISL